MNKSFLLSLLGHTIIILLMVLDLNFGFRKAEPTPPAIMMIDLTKVKISDKTNLPQTSVSKNKKILPKPVKNADKKKLPAPKTQKSVLKNESKPIVKQKEIQERGAAPVKGPDIKKEIPKMESTKTEKKSNTDLQNLLASVEKVRRTPTVKQEEELSQGSEVVQGETEGRIDQILTISEKDYLASELQKCWNVNAGVERADEISVEIKAWINKDGSVRDVKIINSMSIPSFQTVAESAKRAIYVCNNRGVDSPFRILAEKYADRYGDWKEISFKFNPLQGIQ